MTCDSSAARRAIGEKFLLMVSAGLLWFLRSLLNP